MRDANGNTVFVGKNGNYKEQFPEEKIVRQSEGEDTKFVVYGFVGSHGDFEEQSWVVDDEQEAIDKATDIYGRDDVSKFTRGGKVFEVEIHEISADDANQIET